MKHLWTLILGLALVLGSSVAEAKKFGGSFGGGFAKVRPMPSFRPSVPKLSIPSTPKVYAPTPTVRPNNWSYPKPRPRQPSPSTYNNFNTYDSSPGLTSNPWFWMYMFHDNNSAQAAPVATPPAAIPPAPPLSYDNKVPVNQVTTTVPAPQYSENKSSTDWTTYFMIGTMFAIFSFVMIMVLQ